MYVEHTVMLTIKIAHVICGSKAHVHVLSLTTCLQALLKWLDFQLIIIIMYM